MKVQINKKRISGGGKRSFKMLLSDDKKMSFPEAKKIAGQIKYPVILKATAGGGGRGMRLCWDDKELEDGWHSARQESAAAFGNDGMYLEKYKLLVIKI